MSLLYGGPLGGQMSGGFGATRVIVSEHALEETEERLFPKSKNRSRRIRKKLVKRFGGEFRKTPSAFKLPDGTIVMHPAIKQQVDAALEPSNGTLPGA